jgi:methylglutaconyl-CoA hydratase
MTRIRVERDGPIARIVLARPEKKNALDEQAAHELCDALSAAGRDHDVRVVLLAADGDDFCAGADLTVLEHMLDAPPDAHRRDAQALGQVFTTIRELPQPVVAAVRGRALAGGAGLANACDLVLAHEDAEFGYPEVRVGFVPAMVMTMLRRSMGEKRAFDLVATGRLITAHEALELGLVSRVFPGADFEDHVESVLQQLVRAAPNALRLTKQLFYGLDARGFREGIALGVEANVEARDTEDFREGMRRFAQRKQRR